MRTRSRLAERAIRGERANLDPKLQSLVDKSISSALRQNIELKHAIVNGSQGISRSGTIVSVTANLVRGDSSVNEATGTLIKPVFFRFSANCNTDQTFSTMRVMLFQWLDASTPLPSGIINNTGSDTAPHGPVYWVNFRKIRILKDEVVALKPRVSAGYDNKILKFQMNLSSLPSIQLPLSGAGVTPQMNGLYLLFISDDAAVNFPQLVWTSELRYTDA